MLEQVFIILFEQSKQSSKQQATKIGTLLAHVTTAEEEKVLKV